VDAEEKEKLFLCCFGGTCQLYSISLEHGFRREMKSATESAKAGQREAQDLQTGPLFQQSSPSHAWKTSLSPTAQSP
jgi:hypothetical protein